MCVSAYVCVIYLFICLLLVVVALLLFFFFQSALLQNAEARFLQEEDEMLRKRQEEDDKKRGIYNALNGAQRIQGPLRQSQWHKTIVRVVLPISDEERRFQYFLARLPESVKKLTTTHGSTAAWGEHTSHSVAIIWYSIFQLVGILPTDRFLDWGLGNGMLLIGGDIFVPIEGARFFGIELAENVFRSFEQCLGVYETLKGGKMENGTFVRGDSTLLSSIKGITVSVQYDGSSAVNYEQEIPVYWKVVMVLLFSSPDMRAVFTTKGSPAHIERLMAEVPEMKFGKWICIKISNLSQGNASYMGHLWIRVFDESPECEAVAWEDTQLTEESPEWARQSEGKLPLAQFVEKAQSDLFSKRGAEQKREAELQESGRRESTRQTQVLNGTYANDGVGKGGGDDGEDRVDQEDDFENQGQEVLVGKPKTSLTEMAGAKRRFNEFLKQSLAEGEDAAFSEEKEAAFHEVVAQVYADARCKIARKNAGEKWNTLFFSSFFFSES